MKFLHTADWHLGVKTNGVDRLDEQKKVLEEILSIANFENVDCVIIAGDIFNVSNPSAEAEELFFDIIQKLSAHGERFIFVLAGNHDDPTRIEAGLPLAGKHNIALIGDLTELSQKSFNDTALVKVIETGKGYIKIQKETEIATIAYLPYPSESRISEKVDSNLSYEEKVKSWASVGAGAFSEESLNIFVSHLFMVGSRTRDLEVKVGDILAVSKDCIPKADYTALGHIHTPQMIGENIYYSGAITALTAGQSELGINIVQSDDGKITSVRSVKLKNLARYEKITVNSIAEAEQKLQAFDDNDIVELEFVQTEPLPASKLKELKKTYGCITNISLIRNFENQGLIPTQNRRFLGNVQLFSNFYKEVRGYEPSSDLVKLYKECIGENDETN